MKNEFILKEYSIKRMFIAIFATAVIVSSFAFVFNGIIGALIAFHVSLYLHIIGIILFPEFYHQAFEYHNAKVLLRLIKEKKLIRSDGFFLEFKIKGYKNVSITYSSTVLYIYRKRKCVSVARDCGLLNSNIKEKIIEQLKNYTN